VRHYGCDYGAGWDGSAAAAEDFAREAGEQTAWLIRETPHYAWLRAAEFRPAVARTGLTYNKAVDNFVLGVVAAGAGFALIVWRRPLAASTVRQQNWFWRRRYGPAEVAFNERAAILIGVFSLALALSLWFDLVWLPVIVLIGGVFALNLWRLRRRE
jgi:hypothetical protein